MDSDKLLDPDLCLIDPQTLSDLRKELTPAQRQYIACYALRETYVHLLWWSRPENKESDAENLAAIEAATGKRVRKIEPEDGGVDSPLMATGERWPLHDDARRLPAEKKYFRELISSKAGERAALRNHIEAVIQAALREDVWLEDAWLQDVMAGFGDGPSDVKRELLAKMINEMTSVFRRLKARAFDAGDSGEVSRYLFPRGPEGLRYKFLLDATQMEKERDVALAFRYWRDYPLYVKAVKAATPEPLVGERAAKMNILERGKDDMRRDRRKLAGEWLNRAYEEAMRLLVREAEKRGLDADTLHKCAYLTRRLCEGDNPTKYHAPAGDDTWPRCLLNMPLADGGPLLAERELLQAGEAVLLRLMERAGDSGGDAKAAEDNGWTPNDKERAKQNRLRLDEQWKDMARATQGILKEMFIAQGMSPVYARRFRQNIASLKSGEKPPAKKKPPDEKKPRRKPLTQNAYLSAKDFAAHFELSKKKADALRKALMKFKDDNLGEAGKAWIKGEKKSPADPVFTFRYGSVQHIITRYQK